MKAKVIRKYRDKHTLEFHKRGEVVELTEKRYNELRAAGDQIGKQYVLKIAVESPESDSDADVINESSEGEEVSENPAEPRNDGFDVMSMRELREYADATYKMTFKVGMKKSEIIEKLRRMEQGAIEEEK